eukprot:3169694-Ditylum_brightwellii.AAC.1
MEEKRASKKNNHESNKRKTIDSSTQAMIALLFKDKKQALLKYLSSSEPPEDHEPMAFVTFQIFNATSAKSILPILISGKLLHLPIKLGKHDSPFQPTIWCLPDTGACLSIGQALFILAICKKYPQLVFCIIKAENHYMPIKLTGVVSDENEHVSKTMLQATELPA